MEGALRRGRAPAAIAVALVALSGGLARAQERVTPDKDPRDARLEALEKKLADQEKEIDDLKKRTPEKPSKPSDTPAPKGGVDMEQSPADAKFEWGYDDGFFVRGLFAGMKYEIKPKARLQLDYRVFAGAGDVGTDQFVIRRVRLGFDGIFSVFGFKFEVDPTRQAGTANGMPIGDFWFQYQQFDEFKLRFGHFKTPFDLDDGMTGDPFLTCIERPMVVGSGNQLAPDYRIGIEMFGSVFDKMFSYWASFQAQNDSNAQVNFQPLYATRIQADVAGASIGGGALFEKKTGQGANLQSTFNIATPAQFVIMKGVGARGWDQRYTVDATYTWGPFWARAAYLWCAQERNHILTTGQNGKWLRTEGLWGEVGWLFFAPPKSSPKPHVTPFDGWQIASLDVEKKLNTRFVGVEMVIRGEWIRSDDGHGKDIGGVRTPSTAANAADVDGQQAWATTVGVNFRPIENVEFMVDWVHLRIGDATRSERPGLHHNDEFLMRAQLEF